MTDFNFNEDLYGKDINDWLSRWDKGEPVWSIEMGGLGPGYEQAIQITTTEIVRHLIDTNYDIDKWISDTESFDQKQWESDKEKIEQFGLKESEIINDLGLSGAQWYAAMNLAINLYVYGPVKIFTDTDLDEDRKIQIEKHFPAVA